MVAACSCMECQRRTGAVFGVMAFFKNDLVIEKLGECKSRGFKSEVHHLIR